MIICYDKQHKVHKIIVKVTVLLLPPILFIVAICSLNFLTSVVVIYLLEMYDEIPKRTSDRETLSSAIDSNCKLSCYLPTHCR